MCIFKEQAELLLDLDFFEIDMSYKRIGKAGLNEVVSAALSPAFVRKQASQSPQFITSS